LKTKAEPPPSKKAVSVSTKKPNKNLETRIKRLEETMAKLNARRAEVERKLAEPGAYQDAEKLKTLLLDQAYVGKELEQVEGEWLAKQAELEQS
jgi:ATP-binding cassette, subfamily F, member 3